MGHYGERLVVVPDYVGGGIPERVLRVGHELRIVEQGGGCGAEIAPLAVARQGVGPHTEVGIEGERLGVLGGYCAGCGVQNGVATHEQGL